MKTLAGTWLALTGKRMSDLASSISRELGVSGFWARQVCAPGKRCPAWNFCTAWWASSRSTAERRSSPSRTPNRALLPLLVRLELTSTDPREPEDPLVMAWAGFNDVRNFALRQARDVPPERWNVLNATLKALMDLDGSEDQ